MRRTYLNYVVLICTTVWVRESENGPRVGRSSYSKMPAVSWKDANAICDAISMTNDNDSPADAEHIERQGKVVVSVRVGRNLVMVDPNDLSELAAEIGTMGDQFYREKHKPKAAKVTLHPGVKAAE